MANVLTPREFINVELDENLQEGHEDSGCTFQWSTIWSLMEDYHKYRATAESLNDESALPIHSVSVLLPLLNEYREYVVRTGLLDRKTLQDWFLKRQ